MMRNKITLLGPLPREGESLGGAKVSFDATCHLFKNQYGSNCRIIDTSRRRTGVTKSRRMIADIQAAISSFNALRIAIRDTDILMINMSSGGLLLIGWIYIRLAKARGCRVIVKLFGGDFFSRLESLPGLVRHRYLQSLALADLVCLQTLEMMRQAQVLKNTMWLPNARDLPSSLRRITRSQDRMAKLVFLSHIREDKGVLDILEASKAFEKSIHVDFYGSLGFGISADAIDGYDNCSYKGKLEPKRTPETLAQYDALVLPTYFPGEGYPGVVIEALQIGIPVIVSRWRSIPEIISDGENGLLVPPKSPNAISNAVNRLHRDVNLYAKLAFGALTTGERFRSAQVYGPIFDRIAMMRSEISCPNKTAQ